MDMKIHTALWRRFDLPGHEACRVVSRDGGWQVAGTAAFAYDGKACRMDYAIACDERWRTLSAEVSGWIGDVEIHVEISREDSGLWRLHGRECHEVSGCTDIDLNFSPSTNLLPIRRL